MVQDLILFSFCFICSLSISCGNFFLSATLILSLMVVIAHTACCFSFQYTVFFFASGLQRRQLNFGQS